MGLNTIFSYVYWNLLEPQQGEWKYGDPTNNVTRYFELAQEEGLVSGLSAQSHCAVNLQMLTITRAACRATAWTIHLRRTRVGGIPKLAQHDPRSCGQIIQ